MEIVKLKEDSYTDYIEQNRYPLIVITEKPAFSNMAYYDINGYKHAYDNLIVVYKTQRKPVNFFFIFHLYSSGWLWMNDRNWIGFSSNEPK